MLVEVPSTHTKVPSTYAEVPRLGQGSKYTRRNLNTCVEVRVKELGLRAMSYNTYARRKNAEVPKKYSEVLATHTKI